MSLAHAAPAAARRAISLETIGMTKVFPSLTALEDVSIKVPAGTLHALLGENGAGKSTAARSRSPIRVTPTPTASAWSISISRWCRP